MLTRFSNRELFPIYSAYETMLRGNAPVNESANAIVAYRGDGSDMDGRQGPRSDTAGTGTWFTSKPTVAASYGNVGKYLLRLERPFVFDAKGAYWNNVDFEPLKDAGETVVKIPVHKYYWGYYDDDGHYNPHYGNFEEWRKVSLDDVGKRWKRLSAREYVSYSIPYTLIDEDAFNTLSKEQKRVLSSWDDFDTKKVLDVFKSIPQNLLKHGEEHGYWHFDHYDIDYGATTVNDVVRYARSLGGYDGVIIRNVVDGGSDIYDTYDEFGSNGDSFEEYATQTEYVVFDDSDFERIEE